MSLIFQYFSHLKKQYTDQLNIVKIHYPEHVPYWERKIKEIDEKLNGVKKNEQ